MRPNPDDHAQMMKERRLVQLVSIFVGVCVGMYTAYEVITAGNVCSIYRPYSCIALTSIGIIAGTLSGTLGGMIVFCIIAYIRNFGSYYLGTKDYKKPPN
jgi:hypothetical protein